MSFFKVDMKRETECRAGILYVLVFILDDGTEVYKIGVTSRDVQYRVCEILSSFWSKYRYFPYCRPKKFSSMDDVYAKEAMMHKYFDEYRYEPEHKFSGSTEFFKGVELDEVIRVYKLVKDGVDVLQSK